MNTPLKPDPPPELPQSPDSAEEAPAALIAGLKSLADHAPQFPGSIPQELDDAILAAARTHLRASRLGTGLRWSLSIAAAIILLLCISLPFILRSFNTSPSRGLTGGITSGGEANSGGGGGGDIMPAFALARQLQAGQHPDAHWDINGDGQVNADDVAALAQRAVKINRDQPAPPPVAENARFLSVALFIDPHGRKLAAYQIAFAVKNARARIVGIENGEGEAFGSQPPYYDLAAQAGGSDHLTLAMFSTLPADKIPAGRVRVATIHLMIEGPAVPEFTAALRTAADPNGEKFPADAVIQPEEQP